MTLFCGCTISSKITGALHWWRERNRERELKHQQATSTTAMKEKLETEVIGMLTSMDADSLACDCGIMGLDVPEQKKGNCKLLLKYILRQTNSEDVKGSDGGGYSWYTKLYDHLEAGFSKKVTTLSV